MGPVLNSPELVSEREMVLGPSGTVEVEIGTALAKVMYPKQDQRYRIVAAVADASHRTVMGSGTLMVARRSLYVSVRTARGYYRAGDTIVASCFVRSLAGKPVVGRGVLRLLAIHYENAEPVETEVSRWDLSTDDQGTAILQIKAPAAGQYRLVYAVSGVDGEVVEGGQLFTITEVGQDGSMFRFKEIELVPDRSTFQPGDKVALQINANREGAVVLLFERPARGVYRLPRVVRLDGKSTVVEIRVLEQDSPNFFVEAVTVHGGRLHVATREILVPPAGKITHVEVVPGGEAYRPGQTAKVLLKLTDNADRPVVGSTVMTLYNQDLERSAGGSNVPDVREFFWKWRRDHQVRGDTNGDRISRPLTLSRDPPMFHSGLFGEPADASRDFDSPSERSPGRSSYDLVQDTGNDFSLSSPVPSPRSADASHWFASLETNAEGVAEVEMNMPKTLATWIIRVWSMGPGTCVGQGKAKVATRLEE